MYSEHIIPFSPRLDFYFVKERRKKLNTYQSQSASCVSLPHHLVLIQCVCL